MTTVKIYEGDKKVVDVSLSPHELDTLMSAFSILNVIASGVRHRRGTFPARQPYVMPNIADPSIMQSHDLTVAFSDGGSLGGSVLHATQEVPIYPDAMVKKIVEALESAITRKITSEERGKLFADVPVADAVENFDSLEALQFQLTIEDDFKIDVEDALWEEKIQTLSDIEKLIKTTKEKQHEDHA